MHGRLLLPVWTMSSGRSGTTRWPPCWGGSKVWPTLRWSPSSLGCGSESTQTHGRTRPAARLWKDRPEFQSLLSGPVSGMEAKLMLGFPCWSGNGHSNPEGTIYMGVVSQTRKKFIGGPVNSTLLCCWSVCLFGFKDSYLSGPYPPLLKHDSLSHFI